MTRTPRKELRSSNGHARASTYGSPRALIGTLILTGKAGAPQARMTRPQMLVEMGKAARGGGVDSYVVRQLADPAVPGLGAGDLGLAMFSLGGGGRAAAVRPLAVYRLRPDGREEPVRGLTLEGMTPRSLRDIVAIGKDPVVYNFSEGGPGFAGIPTSIVSPALLFSDVEVRRSVGKHKKPPLYPRPAFDGDKKSVARLAR